jgi:ketosteroid isomerase-like protein
MRCQHITFAVAFIILCSAPTYAQAPTAPPPLPSITLPAELDRVLRDYERAWKNSAEDALADLFTPDGFVPTGQAWVRGRDAIRATYANSGGGLQLRALAFAVQDTVGYIVGAYGYGESAPVPDRGKFVLALRRARGGPWLIAADIDQSNRQPSGNP